MSAPLTHNSLRDALSRLPLGQGDVIFTHSNLGFFGRPEGGLSSDQLCEMFFEAIMAALGGDGTLIVPAFTYSFPRKQVFDIRESILPMGVFAEWIHRQPESIRSEDPCYSVVAIGGNAASLVDNAPSNSFGDNSFFDRFDRVGGKVLNLNFDAGSTFIHYVERRLNVPYRFDKTFSGAIVRNGETCSATSTIWVRYLSDDSLEFDSKAFSKLACENDMFHIERLGRGQVGLISARDTYKLIEETLPKRPWFLTKAESLGILYPRIVREKDGDDDAVRCKR